jgi:hypothetical protein
LSNPSGFYAAAKLPIDDRNKFCHTEDFHFENQTVMLPLLLDSTQPRQKR